MCEAFDRALRFVLAREGGYANHPADRGGATNMGITTRVYDAFRTARTLPTRSVRDIEFAEVAAIYEQQYWNEAKCNELPWPIALAHFDASVNHGPRKACQLLQRALGVTDDGVLGVVSMTTLCAQFTADSAALATRMLTARAVFYGAIVARDATQEVFLRGWMLRLEHLRRAMVPA